MRLKIDFGMYAIRNSYVFFLLLGLVFFDLNAQQWSAKNGEISFFSSAPLEDITAHTQKAVSVLDLETGRVTVTVPINSFVFKRRLMQEHFNENYMESERYPFAKFSGKIMDPVDWSIAGAYQVAVKGMMEVHGVAKEYTTRVNLQVSAAQIQAQTTFPIRLADHHITIPRIVRKNIAEVVEVNASLTYLPEKP